MEPVSRRRLAVGCPAGRLLPQLRDVELPHHPVLLTTSGSRATLELRVVRHPQKRPSPPGDHVAVSSAERSDEDARAAIMSVVVNRGRRCPWPRPCTPLSWLRTTNYGL